MRIDEFSNPSDMDSVISDDERVRFACIGFDILSSEPVASSFTYLSFIQRVKSHITNWIETSLP